MTSEISQRILDMLSRNLDGIPQSYLHRAVGVSKSYISMILKNMERSGIIYRIRIGNSYIVKLASRATQICNKLKLGIVWSSEYLFLGHFAKALKDILNVDLSINVYPSALQATSAIARGEIDAVLSPLITQLFAHILTRNVLIVGGGAGGGAKIYKFPKSRSSTTISSETSSMDLCRLVAVRKGMVEEEDVKYFTTPSEAIEIIRMGRARHAVLWHPLTEHIKNVEHSVVAECGEFEELTHCCTLAISRNVGTELVEKISSIYKSAIDKFVKQPLRYIDWYSSITGIDAATLKEGLKTYTYTPEISIRSIHRVVETLGLSIPQKSTLLNAILLHS
ncbi:MAG: hypothetical protein N3D82_01570 [Ignisphaera sp.]|nr:hypothetical protein [Ignisphaera sp.]MCX8167707.1 hypothetical protein [Ignisphaera sp.]MDW8085271.1 hypothetical protein [Ignisphaera sp.]